MALPIPDKLQVSLTVKVGQPYSNSRTTYGAPIVFEFQHDEGYGVLRAQIDSKIAAFTDITWESEAPILFKPFANASQAAFVAFASSQHEFADRITRLWKQAARRKTGQADFQLAVFIYVQRKNTTSGIRRATEARVEASAAAISELLEREGDNMTYGPASQRYWAISHARQPEGTPLEPPTSATFVQLHRIDALQSEMGTSAAMNEPHQNESHERQFVRVGCRLNGGVIDLDLDVADLRRAVGLPPYDLFPAFRPNLEHTTPAVNASDTDHTEPMQQ